MSGQLDGTVVLDLSTVGPGSRCTAYLADLGAEVVKVVPPAGTGRIEPVWYAYGAGRGARRQEVDLKSDEGRESFLGLVEQADVVVESFRPGVADRLGIGYTDAHARNAAIVYCAITGYGQDGPYAEWAGHDLNYLAVGGYLGLQGRRADGGPALPGATIADSAGGGMQAALAIVAALYERTRTGAGRHLDVSTTEGVLSFMSLVVDAHLVTGEEARPGETLLTGRNACYDVYACADGKWIAVGAIEPKFFANLCAALGVGALVDLQYDESRQDELRAALAARFATRDRDEWVAELGPADTCVAPVLGIGELPADPHLLARGAFTDGEHPEHGPFRQVDALVGRTLKTTGGQS